MVQAGMRTSPPALSPGEGDLGCWSGVLIDDAGVPDLVAFRDPSVTREVGGEDARDMGPVSVLTDHSVLEVCARAAVAAFHLPDEARPPSSRRVDRPSAGTP